MIGKSKSYVWRGGGSDVKSRVCIGEGEGAQ